MSPRRIMLRVRAEVGCPLFRAGDPMVLELPGVEVASSANVCALAVAKFVSELANVPCGESPTGLANRKFLCPRSESPVLFEIEELEELHPAKPFVRDLRDHLAQAVAMLRTVAIFRALPAQTLAAIAQRARLETYRDKELVLQKGHPGRAFYVVVGGNLEVVDYAEHGVASVVSRLKEKDCFGEMSLLTGAACAASVVARGNDVSVLALDKADFEQLLRDNPTMADRFTRLLAARLMAANFLLVKEGSKPFAGKLAVMGLVPVVQVLTDSTRSGTLTVRRKDGKTARLGFSAGRLFQASVGDLAGEDAFYEMLGWNDGDFWLEPNDVPKDDAMQTGIMGLLLEGMRRLDEAGRGHDASFGSRAIAET